MNVKVSGQAVTVVGAKGTSTWTAPASARVQVEEGTRRVLVERIGENKQAMANHGLTRALIANMVLGVSEGFQKRLQIYGTGYNCKVAGRTLHLNVGYSGRRRGAGSQFEVSIPEGLEVVIEKDAARGDTEPALFVVRGIDKQLVGEFAAEVRSLRKTEPYKGKGIRYEGEKVRRKQGKTLTGSS